MLIDARHPEETRVAVVKGNRIEEFDFESAEHKQIKGNIYLAKVTRVEPSLQAAFVDFGGNRHGFLAFNEIHPDYYQIPHEDREKLLAEEAEAAEEEARLRAEEEEDGHTPGEEYDAEDESAEALAEDLAEDGVEEIDTSEKDKVATIEEGHVDSDDDDDEDGDDDENDEDDASDEDDDTSDDDASDEENADGGKPRRSRRGRGGRGRNARKGKRRQGGGRSRSKEVDEVRAKRMALRRRYKIQDVIHRRQVLLVQVVKEERGNKGAALTTYLSLAGRYTVLMPNSSHGGGISRKINSASDRKRLKQVVSDLKLPKTMGLIVRTAGLSRNKTEIKRDFDYLARLWDEIRQKTLSSTAPALVHSDSDLIKRAIRDIYNRDIEEVVVEGEEGYKSAKSFMKMLMPSHARRVKAYSDPVPMFQRYGAEDQLRAMYDPVVRLKSGGYLVINPTEALVSIDINSGKSTKEHGIEQTAVATNVEAAREIARQLRLRDMAGLVVIDFIDMEYNSNIRKVERAMKDALKNDRARIQVGRISGFGLMEMSRQRLRTGVLEATTRECPHCDGTGLVRTASSAGLSALRLIEDEAAKGKGSVISLAASTEAAVYLLNSKRDDLIEIEQRYGVSVEVIPEGEDEGAKMDVGSSGPRPTQAPKFEPIVDEDDEDDEPIAHDDEDDGEPKKKKRRRRRGGRGRNKKRDAANDENAADNDSGEDTSNASDDGSDYDGSDDDGEKPKKRRRRGGRRRKKSDEDGLAVDGEEGASDEASETTEAKSGDEPQAEEPSEEPEEKPKKKPARKRAPRKKKAETAADTSEAAEASSDAPSDSDAEAEPAEAEEKPKKKPARKRAPRKKKADAEAEAAKSEPVETKSDAAAEDNAAKETAANDATSSASAPAESASDDTAPSGKKRGGWWQRTFGE
jgi:ribonuclease E